MRLIGQNKLQNFINNSSLETLPHFIILWGPKKCGKTVVTDLLASHLNIPQYKFDNKVENVRNIISTIYNVKEPAIYCCDNLTKMSVSAKNSLLKVTEETPDNAYIVLHTTDNILATLHSRARVFKFEPYTVEDFKTYAEYKNIELPERIEVLAKSVDSFEDFEYCCVSGKFKQAIELSDKVWKYIHEVSRVNAFKILSSLCLKKEDEGIDPIFFLTVVLNSFINQDVYSAYSDIIVEATISALQLLRNDIFSKQSIMDKWILNIMEGLDKVC